MSSEDFEDSGEDKDTVGEEEDAESVPVSNKKRRKQTPSPTGIYHLIRNEEKLDQVLTKDETGAVKPAKGTRKITYLKVFNAIDAEVSAWEVNRTSPRYNQPILYRVTLDSQWSQTYSAGQPTSTENVHWTRIVHIPGRDIQSANELLATSEIEPILNPALNLDKILGASGEGYWKSCFMGLVISTHPQLGTSTKVDKAAIKNQQENWDNTLTRSMFLQGAAATTIAPSVVDPSMHIEKNIEAICIQKGCPKRKYMGSERGELASGQDEGDWNDQIRIYHRTYATPRVAVPLIDRFIMIGACPEPAGEGYTTEWQDPGALSKLEMAQVAAQLTTAMSTAISTGVVPTMMTQEDYQTEIMGMDPDTSDRVIKNRDESGMPPPGEAGAMGGPAPPMEAEHYDPETGKLVKEERPVFGEQTGDQFPADDMTDDEYGNADDEETV